MPLYDNLADWQSAQSGERELAVRTLGKSLPDGFRFDGLHSFEMAGRRHEIAQFMLGAARFSLVPGGAAALGFDASQWMPTPEMLESWEDTAQGFGMEENLRDYVEARTSPLRSVGLPPMLVEVQHAEVGWRPIDPASDKVQELLQKYPRGVTEVSSITTRVMLVNGTVTAEQADESELSHASVTAPILEAGFRLPAPDEWEYLCGAGAATLFRWGDHVPCDRYPSDVRAGRDAVQGDWEYHRAANAFGLYIASNPYYVELTNEAGLTRGGDGGCSACGGTGFLSGWLPLASAWNDPDFCRQPPENEIALGYTVARRVLPLV